jgi:hypothetical protein
MSEPITEKKLFYLYVIGVAIFLLGASSLVVVSNASNATTSCCIFYPGDQAGYILETASAVNVKMSSSYAIPTMTCTSNSEYITFIVGIGHVNAVDVGVELQVTCNNGIPSYAPYLVLPGQSIPLSGIPAPGKVIAQTLSEDVTTGTVSYTITFDGRLGTGNANVGTSSSSTSAQWLLYASGCPPCLGPVPKFTAIKTTGDKITLGTHTGSLGSFLKISSDTITGYELWNTPDDHVLAKPTTITSTSSSFSIKWVAAS